MLGKITDNLAYFGKDYAVKGFKQIRDDSQEAPRAVRVVDNLLRCILKLKNESPTLSSNESLNDQTLPSFT
jgi:hypothetical protein